MIHIAQSRTPNPRPTRTRRILIVGISGPDGAGKSSLVSELQRRFVAKAVPVGRSYLYGCVVCRRVTVAGVMRETRGGARLGLAAKLRTLHGFVDAAELAIRLTAASLSVTVRLQGREKTAASRAVLLTDRSPLDGLVKHDPGHGSLLETFYLWLASRYDLIFALEAPPAVLAVRDADHDSASLSILASRYEHARQLVRHVIPLTTADKSKIAVADEAEEAIR